MKIKYDELETKKIFDDVPMGKVFSFEIGGGIMMVIARDNRANAIDLGTGSYCNVDAERQVISYPDATIITGRAVK